MNGKLFYEDPYLREFSANITDRGVEDNGLHYVILDQTAFYPTGGGQPCDVGEINGTEIVDVEEVDGQIRHRSNTPIEGESVQGKIDWKRRLDHMQQHTGQHILSAAFEQLYDAATVGFHMGKEIVTIDLAISELSDGMILAAIELTNQVVMENREITARFVSEEELSRMPLRKAPTVQENIRIVTVDGFDYSPCGGTHPYRTGEVGPVHILGFERGKNSVRVEFICGHRCVSAFAHKQIILRRMTQLLSSSEPELVSQLERTLGDKREQEKMLSDLKERMLDIEAEQLAKQTTLQLDGSGVVVQAFNERSMQELQRLAKKMTTENAQIITLLLSYGSKTQIVCARGKEPKVPMDAWIKYLLPKINGKGGGNKEMAQGGGPSEIPHVVLIDDALNWIKEAYSETARQ